MRKKLFLLKLRNAKKTSPYMDEHPRPETTMDKLSKLRPAFKENGSVTAGNACGRNDGASALVIMREQKLKSLDLIQWKNC